MKNESLIREKSFTFAVRIIRLSKFLDKKRETIISRQILRSGTSIGANIEEAQGGVTKKEFLLRITIAYREAMETFYWLRLMRECGTLDEKSLESLMKDCEELVRMLSAAQKTLKAQTSVH